MKHKDAKTQRFIGCLICNSLPDMNDLPDTHDEKKFSEKGLRYNAFPSGSGLTNDETNCDFWYRCASFSDSGFFECEVFYEASKKGSRPWLNQPGISNKAAHILFCKLPIDASYFFSEKS